MYRLQIAALARSPMLMSMLVDASSHPDFASDNYIRQAPVLTYTVQPPVLDALKPDAKFQFACGTLPTNGLVRVGYIVVEIEGFRLFSLFDSDEPELRALLRKIRETGKLGVCLVTRTRQHRFFVVGIDREQIKAHLLGEPRQIYLPAELVQRDVLAATLRLDKGEVFASSPSVRGTFACPLFKLTIPDTEYMAELWGRITADQSSLQSDVAL